MIICDGCGEDISYSGGANSWRLVLGVEPLHIEPGNATMDVYILPYLSSKYRFCYFECLKKWLESQGYTNYPRPAVRE